MTPFITANSGNGEYFLKVRVSSMEELHAAHDKVLATFAPTTHTGEAEPVAAKCVCNMPPGFHADACPARASTPPRSSPNVHAPLVERIAKAIAYDEGCDYMEDRAEFDRYAKSALREMQVIEREAQVTQNDLLKAARYAATVLERRLNLTGLEVDEFGEEALQQLKDAIASQSLPPTPTVREIDEEMVERAAKAMWDRSGSSPATWGDAIEDSNSAEHVAYVRADARSALSASQAQLKIYREALERVADIMRRNFGRQNEKLADIEQIACNALSQNQEQSE